MIPDQNILTSMMLSFQSVLKSGANNLYPDAYKLLMTLIIIDIAILFIHYLIDNEDQNTKAQIVGCLFKYGFFIFLVTKVTDKTGYSILVNSIVKSFMFIGIKASNSGLTEDLFTNPSQIAQHGLNIASNMITALHATELNSSSAEVQALVWLSCIGVIFSFFYIAIRVFYLSMQFTIVSAAGLILVPFGAWHHTEFIFEKIKHAIINIGYKYMFLSFIIAITYSITSDWALIPENITYQQSLYILFSSVALAILSHAAERMASMSGVLSLGAAIMAVQGGKYSMLSAKAKMLKAATLRNSVNKSLNKAGNYVGKKFNFKRV